MKKGIGIQALILSRAAGTGRVPGRHAYLLLLVCWLLVYSCKDVYRPEIKNTSKILVVDGLITDEPKPFTIRISTALKIDSLGYVPEKGATVYVTDDLGRRFEFNEWTDGNYISNPAGFVPQTGRKYVLTIETTDGKIYKSSEQELLPKGNMSNLANYPKKVTYYVENNNKLRSIYAYGADFMASFDLTNEQNPYYRFSTTVLVEYLTTFKGSRVTYYKWLKYTPEVNFNINERLYNVSGIFQQNLGFCPIDSVFYTVVMRIYDVCCPPVQVTEYNKVHQFAVSFRQYHINKDIYEYYSLLNKQLGADKRIFEPLTFQIAGNITCENDPDTKAFGRFDVSSVSVKSFTIDYNLIKPYYTTKEISIDMDSIPEFGGDTIPAKFWIR